MPRTGRAGRQGHPHGVSSLPPVHQGTKHQGGGGLPPFTPPFGPVLRPCSPNLPEGGPGMWIGYIIGFFASPIEFIRNLLRSRSQNTSTKEDGHD